MFGKKYENAPEKGTANNSVDLDLRQWKPFSDTYADTAYSEISYSAHMFCDILIKPRL